jgi:3-oxoacyl-[acyl-carrier protein] reductase
VNIRAMDLGIEGRVALVCGASKGIGRAIGAALVAEGVKVAVASRSRERIDATAAEIGATGFVWDSSDVERVPALLAEVEAALGPVDILICNTGGPPLGPALEMEPEQWEAAYRDLVLAPMALLTACVPAMRSRGFGRVVNVASTSVREPIPYLMLSNSHRAATLAAFKTVSRDAAADGVTINTVMPGRIATDRMFGMLGDSEEALAGASADIPAGRLGTPEEFAAVAAFLCGVGAAYVTGTAVAVDGGLLRGI